MSLLADAARDAAAVIASAADAAAPQPPASTTPPAPAAGTTAPAVDANAIRAEARAAERDRIKAIVGHAEAEGRTALAHQLAFGTDLAADAAASLLTTAPKAESARTLTGATVPQPNVKPQASADPGDAKSRLAAARVALTGAKA